MILIIKDGKVIAYHDDGQDVIDRYPDCTFLQIEDNKVTFDDEDLPVIPTDGKELMDLKLSVDKTKVAVNETVTVTLQSLPARDIVIDLLVDGPPSNEIQLINGIGQSKYAFADIGKYLIEAIYGDIRKYLFVEVA